jgi:hypothetical protein
MTYTADWRVDAYCPASILIEPDIMQSEALVIIFANIHDNDVPKPICRLHVFCPCECTNVWRSMQ